jgi:amino acid transporter
MDLTPYIPWIVFLHVLGAFMFVAGHGVSMFVVFRVRREQDRRKLEALLDLSGWSLGVAGIGLLILALSGILAGIVLGSFGRLWIWVSLVLFVVIAGLMTPVGSKYLTGLRAAIGQRTRNLKKDDPDPTPATDAELAAAQASSAPMTLLALGAGGFVVILWLMMFRPF